jgi:DNA-binding response OmpR family regulator
MKSNKYMLVVSGNPDLLKELQALLMESQLQIAGTKVRGPQLIDVLKLKTPDLAILDIPLISDVEIKQFVDIRRQLDIPIIVLNSNDVKQKMVEVFKLGEQNSFTQPMTLDNLIMRIKTILAIK